MICPHCATQSKFVVKETRLQDGDVVRRRACDACGKHFGTRERVDPTLPVGARTGNVRKTPTVKPTTSNAVFGVWK